MAAPPGRNWLPQVWVEPLTCGRPRQGVSWQWVCVSGGWGSIQGPVKPHPSPPLAGASGCWPGGSRDGGHASGGRWP